MYFLPGLWAELIGNSNLYQSALYLFAFLCMDHGFHSWESEVTEHSVVIQPKLSKAIGRPKDSKERPSE